jgi:hypothetical protein
MPSSATVTTNHNTAQHSQQRHHTYESEEEEEEEGGAIRAAARPVLSSALPWRPAVPPGGARVHGARTTAGMDADASYRCCGPAREATSHQSQEEHPYGDLLHLLHALRYQVSGSPTPLVDHLIARFIDLMKRDR